MLVKPSKFNFRTYNDQNEILLANTYSGRMVKCATKKTEEVEKLLSAEQTETKSRLGMQLYERGILVDTNEDENQKIIGVQIARQAKSTLLLMILPTEQCNFRCAYCPESFGRGSMSKEVQDKVVDFVRKNIRHFSHLHVQWFGGEPLLEKEIIVALSKKFLDICADMKRGYSADITTNGYLLDYECFQELLSYCITNYQITLDGLKSSHNKLRALPDGGETYDTIVKNLTDIHCKTKSARFVINLRTNFTYDMLSEIPAYVDWFNQTFETDPRFLMMISQASDFGGEKVKGMKEQLISGKADQELFFKKLLESNIQAKDVRCLEHILQKGNMACYTGLRSFFLIDSHGNIRKCSCNLTDDVHNLLGNVTQEDKVRFDQYTNLRWSVPMQKETCEDCFLQPLCLSHRCPYKILALGHLPCPDAKWLMQYYLKIFDKANLFEYIEE